MYPAVDPDPELDKNYHGQRVNKLAKLLKTASQESEIERDD